MCSGRPKETHESTLGESTAGSDVDGLVWVVGNVGLHGESMFKWRGWYSGHLSYLDRLWDFLIWFVLRDGK